MSYVWGQKGFFTLTLTLALSRWREREPFGAG